MMFKCMAKLRFHTKSNCKLNCKYDVVIFFVQIKFKFFLQEFLSLLRAAKCAPVFAVRFSALSKGIFDYYIY